ncbi:MAG TPA: helix-turn-helix domain-containing protein [Croceibacterium sp.]
MEELAQAALVSAGLVACARALRSPRVHELGPIEAFGLHSDSLRHDGDAPRAIVSREHGYAIVLMIEGEAKARHYGHSCALAPDDFLLVDGAAPLEFAFAEPGEILVLGVPARVLRNHLPSPDQFCGLALRSHEGIAQGAAEMTRCIVGQLEDGLSPQFHGRVARNLLDTLATAFSMALDGSLKGSPLLCSRNARVRLRIERDLRDPELSPARIAARLRMSPRYLRAIFAASDETVSAYILRRRLEECARELADPEQGRASITQIAFGWGFNSAPHFTRSFRERYGMSPRQYRTCAASRGLISAPAGRLVEGREHAVGENM